MRPRILVLGLLIGLFSCDNNQEKIEVKPKSYTLIEEGEIPFSFKTYQLNNGLKVYLSKNEEKPRIQTYIGVKVGSKNDPAHVTGLAHYLEHMMFKGTSKIGTDNWVEEEKIIKEITQLYELRSKETNEQKRTDIYHQIDSLSGVASQYAIANEYDKLIAEIGGQGTNAYTSMDQTVYLTNIPAVEIQKWAKIEAERFSELVLRIFHTELEAVYEEFNIGQDSDNDRVFNTLTKKLFPNHPYGTQSTIGKAEHLKNPSMVEMGKFFDKYYVPNNMVMALSGDLDYDKTIEIIANEFSILEEKELTKPKFVASELDSIERVNIVGNETGEVVIAYKLDGLNKDNNVTLEIIDRMFTNGYAGLIDMDLLSKRKVQDAYSFLWSNNDYSLLIFGATPKYKQSLDEVEKLLVEEIEKLKSGDFENWLPQACLNDIKKDNLQAVNENTFRANELLSTGIYNKKTSEYLNRFGVDLKIEKPEILAFLKDHLKEEYVVVKKEKGEAHSVKVKAPKINPITLRKNVNSEFYKQIKNEKSLESQPDFIDFKKVISQNKIGDYYYLKNKENDLFSLNLVFDFGSFDEPLTALATEYLKMLGSGQKSNDDINTAFFKNGVSWKVHTNNKTMTLKIEGLSSNYNEGIQQVFDLFNHPKSDIKAFSELINSKKKKRKDLEFDKSYLLWEALLGKVQYKSDNPYISSFSNADLNQIKEEDLIKTIQSFLQKPHEVFYFGPLSSSEFKVQSLDLIANTKKNVRVNHKSIVDNSTNKDVHFVNHNMVQSELIFVAQKGEVNQNNYVFNKLFNSYFRTLAFREIRESKALAYSTYITVNEAKSKGHHDYIYAYVGCQVDKFPMALASMESLLKSSPTDKLLFDEVKTKLIKELKSKRYKNTQIFWEWKKLERKGFDSSIYKNAMKELEAMKFEDFRRIFDAQVKNLNYSLLVLGNDQELDIKQLESYGPVKTYTKNEILP